MPFLYPRHEFPSGRILLVGLSLLVVLCAGPANSASEPGTVTIVRPDEPERLDPGDCGTGNISQVLTSNVLESLTGVNPADGSIVPRLAHSWKHIDTNTWHFFLRKGVKFHDGADFNADAVIFSINRVYDKRIGSTTREHFFTAFKMQGKALDSYTLELKTDKFQPLLPTLLSNLAICSPNTPVDKVTRQPIGTGPYRFVRWDAGAQIILERFDGYWGKQPQVKKAIYLWRKESAVRASMVLIGEADLASSIAIQDANRPDMDCSYLNTETTFLRIGGVWEPPLNDRRFRLALNYAVDRDAIRGTIFSKDVIPATQIYMPSIFGYNPDLKPWPYDLQKAKQLLDEARKDGVPVDREILLVGRIAHFPGSDELAEALMSMYKAAGLNVKLKMAEVGVYQPYNKKPYPPGPFLLQKTHDNGFGDAVFSVPLSYSCGGTQSSTCDKMLDDLIEKAQVATSEERRTLWQTASKRVHEEIVPNVLLFHMVGYVRVGKRIAFKPSFATTIEIPLSQMTFN
jgi:peptide/nickel transport system substrate-binding protein